MSYSIQIEGSFSSAHKLTDYHGNCENLHGHNWKVVVEIKSSVLDNAGMLIDFGEAEKKLDKVLASFDHKYLNEVHPFDKINPTAENISKHIFDVFSEIINDNNRSVSKVTTWEDETSCATYNDY